MKQKITNQSAIEAFRISCLAVNGTGCSLDGKCHLTCESAKYFISTIKSLSYNQNKHHDSLRNNRKHRR